MIYVNLEQGTQEWLEFRRSRIGASEASIIEVCNPWCTPNDLYLSKMNSIEQADNPAMKKGRALEPIAREMFIAETGIFVMPTVGVSEERPWQMASFDGISEDGTIICEIKCGGEDLYLKAKSGDIPIYYRLQVQHQICVSKAVKAFYVCFYEGKIAIIEVKPDWELIEKMIDKQSEFMELMHKMEPPPLTDRDYTPIESERGSQMLKEYFSLGIEEKRIKERRDLLKQEIIDLNPQRNFILDGSKVYQKTTVSYNTKKMAEEGIDISRYKSVSKPYWMLTSPGRTKAL